jgi:formimidoylglutamate deiminase
MGSAEDSFWTWREVMYSFLKRLDPDQVCAIAAQLFREMLSNGYTSVGEFHYLHHAPNGRPYVRSTEMALALLRAAEQTGIAITLLPSLYAYSAFGKAPLKGPQKRFATTPESLLAMLGELRETCAGNPDIRLGVAPHSLRAVDPAMLKDLLAAVTAFDPTAPIHIHVAQVVAEVNDCLSWSEKRPAQWLLDNMPVDARWCLVHCTNVSTPETEKLAASGAVVGLCPTTGANLGDGTFPFARFREKQGRFAIGGDIHVSQTPVEELRWLEYNQRLALRRRNIAASESSPSVGGSLWREAASGGAQALGRKAGGIAPGMRADLVVLDDAHINLAGRRGDALLDSLIFCGSERMVRHVMVGGRWLVRDGHHSQQEAIAARYAKVRSALT